MRVKVFIIILSLLILSQCATFSTFQSFDPESKEFLSKVRYIISSDEEKIFRELPSSERKKFKEDLTREYRSLKRSEKQQIDKFIEDEINAPVA